MYWHNKIIDITFSILGNWQTLILSAQVMNNLQVKAMFLSVITIALTKNLIVSAFLHPMKVRKLKDYIATIFTDQMLKHISIGLIVFVID